MSDGDHARRDDVGPVEIRPLRVVDAAWLAPLRRANAAFMAPHEPLRPPDYLTESGQRAAIQRVVADERTYPFAILVDGRGVGQITISNVSYGAFRSATLGYWVAEHVNGRGVATRAVGAAVRHAFDALHLHRIEAGTFVDNLASQRVLRRNGFRWFGYSPRHLHLGGAWRDHLLFVRLTDDPAPRSADEVEPRPEGRGRRLLGRRRPGARPAPAVVRPARAADAEALARLLLAASQEPERPLPPPEGGAREERRRRVALAEGNEGLVLVAEAAEGVVGRLDLRRDAHPAARHVAELGLVVERGSRGAGVGTLLVEAAERWAGAAGIDRLEAHVPVGNLPATGFLLARGFAVEGLREDRFRDDGGRRDVLVLARGLGPHGEARVDQSPR